MPDPADQTRPDGANTGEAAMDRLLRDFAAPQAPASTDVLWRRVAAQLDARPQQRPFWRRIPELPSLVLPSLGRPARALGTIAAGLALAAAVSLSVLLTNGGTADASFLAAVEGLSTATDHALADGSVSAEEAEGLAQRVALVLAALEDDETLPATAPEQVQQALDALASVEQRLAEHPGAGLGQALTTLGTVQGRVQVALAQGSPALTPADGAADGERPDNAPVTPPAAVDTPADDRDIGPPASPGSADEAESEEDGPRRGPPDDPSTENPGRGRGLD